MLSFFLLVVNGCSRPVSQDTVREYLDETTGMTVFHLPDPIVYHRAAPRLAVHARDYLSLGPMIVTQGGARKYLLWAWHWSTIDRDSPRHAGGDHLLLIVDGEPMRLWPTTGPVPTGDVYGTPVNGGERIHYELTRSQAHRLGSVSRLLIYVEGDEAAGPYLPWQPDATVPGFAALETGAQGPARLVTNDER